MDGKEVTKLRMDKRLIGRRGWVSKEDLQAELAQLPDAADKAMTAQAEPGEADSGISDPPSPGADD